MLTNDPPPFFCRSDAGPTTARLTDPLSMQWNEDYWIRYFIDSNFPSILEAERLVAEAWSMWARFAKNLVVRRVESRQDNALIVTNKQVAGGTGLAPVLGPGRFRTSAEVLLDVEDILSESNAPALLQNLIIHEFGHILGLGHDGDTSSIMHPLIDGKSSISPRDAEKIGAIYGRPDVEQFGIGTIKFYDAAKKKGVVAPQGVKGSANDVYFEASEEDARKLREGQLVQFVLAENTPLGPVARKVGPVARNVSAL